MHAPSHATLFSECKTISDFMPKPSFTPMSASTCESARTQRPCSMRKLPSLITRAR